MDQGPIRVGAYSTIRKPINMEHQVRQFPHLCSVLRGDVGVLRPVVPDIVQLELGRAGRIQDRSAKWKANGDICVLHRCGAIIVRKRLCWYFIATSECGSVRAIVSAHIRVASTI